MNALNVLCAQLMRNLFAIAKFLFTYLNTGSYELFYNTLSLTRGRRCSGILYDIIYSHNGLGGVCAAVVCLLLLCVVLCCPL